MAALLTELHSRAAMSLIREPGSTLTKPKVLRNMCVTYSC